VFSLSLRDVELLLAERGIVVSYETVRRWCKKFGQSFANRLRQRRPRPGDKWHMDEVFIGIRGVQQYLLRASQSTALPSSGCSAARCAAVTGDGAGFVRARYFRTSALRTSASSLANA
jgi:hypothetical protein